jgi:hypothetical protein
MPDEESSVPPSMRNDKFVGVEIEEENDDLDPGYYLSPLTPKEHGRSYSRRLMMLRVLDWLSTVPLLPNDGSSHRDEQNAGYHSQSKAYRYLPDRSNQHLDAHKDEDARKAIVEILK